MLESCNNGANYSSIDIDSNCAVYSTLSRGHAAENLNSNSVYTKLGNATVGSIYSVTNTNLDKTSSISPSHTYASVKFLTHGLQTDKTGEVARYLEKT